MGESVGVAGKSPVSGQELYRQDNRVFVTGKLVLQTCGGLWVQTGGPGALCAASETCTEAAGSYSLRSRDRRYTYVEVSNCSGLQKYSPC